MISKRIGHAPEVRDPIIKLPVGKEDAHAPEMRDQIIIISCAVPPVQHKIATDQILSMPVRHLNYIFLLLTGGGISPGRIRFCGRSILFGIFIPTE